MKSVGLIVEKFSHQGIAQELAQRLLGDDFALLHGGKIVARGTAQDLDASDDPLVQAFMRSEGGG